MKKTSRSIRYRTSNKKLSFDSPIPVKFCLLTFFLLITVGFSIYSNILNAPFFYDDVVFLNDPQVHMDRLSQIWDILISANSWRRIGTATFALNYYVNGINPFGYHLVNIIIHLFNGLLLFYLTLRTLTLSSIPDAIRKNAFLIALLGSLIWVVHPVQIMAVTYTVQRFTSLAAMFFLLSLVFYLLGRINPSGWRFMFFAFSCLSGLLALGSKENAAMLPFIILLYEFFFFSDNRKTGKKTGTALWFLGLLAFTVIIILIYVGPDLIERINRDFLNRGLTPYERLMTEWRVVVLYITLLVFPYPSRLNVDYDLPLSKGLLTPPSTILSLLLLVSLLVLSIYQAKRRRVFSFAILWFFMSLVIESTIYPLDLAYEHRLYLPSMGPVMLFAGFLCTLMHSPIRSVGIVIGLLVVVLFSYWTYQRNMVWQSPITLWEDNVKKSPSKARVHGNLGKAYLDAGEYEKARSAFEKVITLDPRLLGAYDNLAVIYIDHYKDYDKAKEYLDEALKRKPDFPSPYLNMGVIHLRLRQLPKAISNFEKVLQLDPNHLMGHYNLAACYFNLKDYGKAISILEKGVSIWPRNSQLSGLLGAAYYNQENRLKAEAALRKALELDPKNGMAIHYLDVVLSTTCGLPLSRE